MYIEKTYGRWTNINREMAFLKEPIDGKFFILGSSLFHLETQYGKKVS